MRVELLSTPSCSSHRPRSAFRAPSLSFTSLPSLSLQPPLVQAIFNRDVEEVRSLLNQKENINVLVSAAQPAAQAPTRLLLRFPAALGATGCWGAWGGHCRELRAGGSSRFRILPLLAVFRPMASIV